ncbi:MAG: hypothetical protein IJ489_03665 [Clostridia bacterium]|nr:hypothetical protein [Clostridia bacterium]
MNNKQQEGRERLCRILAKYEKIHMKKKSLNHPNGIGKRIIAAAFVFLLTLGFSVTGLAVISVSKEKNKELETVYIPQILPDGYLMTEYEVESHLVQIVWEKEYEKIIFKQYVFDQKMQVQDIFYDLYTYYNPEKKETYSMRFDRQNRTLYCDKGKYTLELRFPDGISVKKGAEILSSVTLFDTEWKGD